MLVHGTLVSVTGHYAPFMLLASTLMPLATGLLTTWRPSTSLARLISYSLFAGFSYAIGYQAPQSAVQTALPNADGPRGLSVILFAQHFGPALSVSLAQTVFTNRLAANLRGLGADIDAAAIQNVGLGELKALVLGADRAGDALARIDHAVVQTWYLPLGFTCASMIGSLMMEWRSVKEKKS